MRSAKILKRVTRCGDCPHYQYSSGGIHECAEVGEIIRNKEVIPPFCPLTDYPSRIIADMHHTIHLLREPQKNGFRAELLSYVASRLNLNVHASGVCVVIPLPDERKITLQLDYVTNLKVIHGLEIHFNFDEGAFVLLPDAKPPLLKEEVHHEGDNDSLGYLHHIL